MTLRPEIDRWLRDSQWVVDGDPSVGGDAMRLRPDPVPAASFQAITDHLRRNPVPIRPPRDREHSELLSAEANALWLAIGQEYRNLANA